MGEFISMDKRKLVDLYNSLSEKAQINLIATVVVNVVDAISEKHTIELAKEYIDDLKNDRI